MPTMTLKHSSWIRVSYQPISGILSLGRSSVSAGAAGEMLQFLGTSPELDAIPTAGLLRCPQPDMPSLRLPRVGIRVLYLRLHPISCDEVLTLTAIAVARTLSAR